MPFRRAGLLLGVALASACTAGGGSRADLSRSPAATTVPSPTTAGTSAPGTTLENRNHHRTPGPFHRVVLQAAASVVVGVGPAESVTVLAEPSVAERITTEARGGELVIGSRGNYSGEVKVEVAAPDLDGVVLAGSGAIDVSGVDAARFEVEITGTGDVTARGRADEVLVGVPGAGRVRLFDLAGARVAVSLTGSGSIEVTASESLQASLSGAGTVRYAGSPSQIQTQVTGAGRVEQR